MQTQWLIIEVGCVGMFTIDLVVRGVGAIGAGEAVHFMLSFMNWIDLSAIVPFFIRIWLPDFYDLRFLRAIRLTRILNSLPDSKHGSLSQVVVDIVSNALGALFVPIYFMMLALVVLSSIMYYIERTDSINCHLGDGTVIQNWDSGKESLGNEGCDTDYGCACAGTLTYHTYDGQEWTNEMYASIPDSFWWCIVTFTTVGYGDKYPRTSVGRVVCVFTMFAGIFFLAMPLTIVGSAFADAWTKLEARKLKSEAEEAKRSGKWSVDDAWVKKRRMDMRGYVRGLSYILEEFSDEARTAQLEHGQTMILKKWEAIVDGVGEVEENIDRLMNLYKNEDNSKYHSEKAQKKLVK
jgi:hypothetical protein